MAAARTTVIRTISLPRGADEALTALVARTGETRSAALARLLLTPAAQPAQAQT